MARSYYATRVETSCSQREALSTWTTPLLDAARAAGGLRPSPTAHAEAVSVSVSGGSQGSLVRGTSQYLFFARPIVEYDGSSQSQHGAGGISSDMALRHVEERHRGPEAPSERDTHAPTPTLDSDSTGVAIQAF